jgi:uncharacterized protein YjdB
VINKAYGLTATDYDISIASADTAQHTFDLDAIVLSQPGCGTRSYTIGTLTDGSSVLNGSPTLGGINNATLSYTGNGQATGTATQIITISTANYEDTDVTVTFNAIAKYPVSIAATMTGGEYKNSAYAYDNVIVKKVAGNGIVTGIIPEALYESTDGGGYSSAAAPTNAGAYKLTLSIPAGNATYTGSAVFNFTIVPKPLTIRADDKSAKVGESQPAYTYTATGLLGSDTLLTAPTLACTPDMAKPGTYPINISGAAAGANYTISYQSGALTVSAAPPTVTKVTKVTITNSASTYTYKAEDALHTLQHAVSIEPADATVQDVAWESSDKTIATVSATGLVTFTGKEGMVRITATSSDGPSHYKDIKVVRNVTKIRTPLTTVNITKGKKLTLPIELDDGNIAITKVAGKTFKSSNTKVVTVDSKTGKIKGVKKGTAKITVTTANGKSLTIKVNVVKKAVKLKKFTLTGVKKNALSLEVGKTKDLKIKLAQSKASDLKVTFKSTKKSVAKVDAAGRITALKKGKATITVKVKNKTVKVKVTVK